MVISKLEKIIAGTIIFTAFMFGCGKNDYTTPESSFKNNIKLTKEGKQEEILEIYGFSEEEIKEIKELMDNLNFKNKLPDIKGKNYDIVDTKYCIIDNEEIALLKVIITDNNTGKKEQGYFRAANHLGNWIFLDSIEGNLDRRIETYDESTIKDDTHKSKIIERKKEQLLQDTYGTPLSLLHGEEPTPSMRIKSLVESTRNKPSLRNKLSIIYELEEKYKRLHRTYTTFNNLDSVCSDERSKENLRWILKNYDIVEEQAKDTFSIRLIPDNEEVVGSEAYYIDQTGIIRKGFADTVSKYSEPLKK